MSYHLVSRCSVVASILTVQILHRKARRVCIVWETDDWSFALVL